MEPQRNLTATFPQTHGNFKNHQDSRYTDDEGTRKISKTLEIMHLLSISLKGVLSRPMFSKNKNSQIQSKSFKSIHFPRNHSNLFFLTALQKFPRNASPQYSFQPPVLGITHTEHNIVSTCFNTLSITVRTRHKKI